MPDEYLFKVKLIDGKRIYENRHGYIHCKHNGKLIKAITDWENISYVCYSCGEVVRKDLMPTA